MLRAQVKIHFFQAANSPLGVRSVARARILPAGGLVIRSYVADGCKKAGDGLAGSISTEEACQEAGGRWVPQIFGWMVHVYPFETDPAKVWAH